MLLLKHVKKKEGRSLRRAADVEICIFEQNLWSLRRLKDKNPAGFKRLIELGQAKNLATGQKAELLKLLMFYEEASGPGKQYIDGLIAGLSFNEGEQMKKLGSAISGAEDCPLRYLLTTLSFVEHWSGDGIVAQNIVAMLQKHLPLIVTEGEIKDFNDNAAIARSLTAARRLL